MPIPKSKPTKKIIHLTSNHLLILCVPFFLVMQGTDQSYLEKLHHELGRHSHFVKGSDKRLWSVEFGIRHYAGPVTYVVKKFLEKNKDVQQDMFFDYLEKSTCEFAREVTKFRVNLYSVYTYYDTVFMLMKYA